LDLQQQDQLNKDIMLNLKELEKKLDLALSKETPHSLSQWLINQWFKDSFKLSGRKVHEEFIEVSRSAFSKKKRVSIEFNAITNWMYSPPIILKTTKKTPNATSGFFITFDLCQKLKRNYLKAKVPHFL